MYTEDLCVIQINDIETHLNIYVTKATFYTRQNINNNDYEVDCFLVFEIKYYKLSEAQNAESYKTVVNYESK